MERLFTGTKRGGENLEHKKQRRGENFPLCLYGNQQVPLAGEKKWSLSYEREKARPEPAPPPRASARPLFSRSGGNTRPSGNSGACQPLRLIQLQ